MSASDTNPKDGLNPEEKGLMEIELSEETIQLCRFSAEELEALRNMPYNIATCVFMARLFIEKRKIQMTVTPGDHQRDATSLLLVLKSCQLQGIDPVPPLRIAIGG